MRIGGGVAANFYSGDIQHVGVWDRELSEEEVLSLFLAGAPDVFSQSVLLPGGGRDNAREAGDRPTGTAGGTTGNAQAGSSQSASNSADNDNLILIIIIAVVGIILILAILILVVLLVRRSRRRRKTSGAGGLSTRRTVSRTKTFDGLGTGRDEADEEEILLDSVRTPLTSARATHAPEVAKTMTNDTFADVEGSVRGGGRADDEGDFDVEDSGRRKPRFTRKGSRIHVRFMD